MPHYSVQSFHLNIDEGDSAVHLLLTDDDPKNIVSAVLVDGGREVGAEVIVGLRTMLQRAITVYLQNGNPFTAFDTIVLSHWDGDHKRGIMRMLSESLIQPAIIAARAHGVIDQTGFNTLIDGYAIQSEVCKYHANPGPPTTVMYAPYWKRSCSRIVKTTPYTVPSAEPPVEWKARNMADGRYVATVYTSIRLDNGVVVQGFVPVALLRDEGEKILGYDFFTNQVVMASSTATNASVVSKFLHGNNVAQPVMFCLAADTYICDMDNDDDRMQNWEWKASDDLTVVKLVKKGTTILGKNRKQESQELRPLFPCATSTSNVPSIEAIGPVNSNTTGNNQASIACMIIWPHETYDVSHYFGGDLGDDMEERVLRWSTVPETNVNVRTAVPVNCIKLSHHGSKFSTPALMLAAWRPRLIAVSNGMKANFNHVSWEILMLVMAYTYWRRSIIDGGYATKSLLPTNFPIYLTKAILHETGTFPSVGSIDSLNKPSSANLDWRKMVSHLFKVARDGASFPNSIPADFLLRAPKAAPQADLCDYLTESWNDYAFASLDYFSGFEGFSNGMVKAAAQTVRFVCLWQFGYGVLAQETGYGNLITDYELDWMQGLENTDSMLALHRANEEVLSLTWRLMLVNRKAVNDKTTRNLSTERLVQKSVTGDFIDSQVAMSMKLDPNDYSSSIILPSHEQLPLKSKSRQIRLQKTIRRHILTRELVYFMASDAEVLKGPLTETRAIKDSNLDLFLASLQTGALVFPSELSTDPTWFEIDGSDEMAQWFLSIFGTFDDPAFTLKAQARSTSISAFSFTTRLDKMVLGGVTGKVPDAMITFETTNNLHAFSANTPTGVPDWLAPLADDPNADAVGPAHMILVSLSDKSGIENEAISLAQILSLFEIKTTSVLQKFSALLMFNVDTSPGSKCALWFFPDSHYTTTLRLKFSPATGVQTGPSVIDELTKTLQDVANIAGIAVTQPRVIAKKTWRRVQAPKDKRNAEVESELVFDALVTLTSEKNANLSDKLKTLPVETSLVLAAASTKWIITLDPSKGGTSFGDLLDFFVSLLPGTEGVPPLGEYLPGTNDLFIRRVTYMVPNKGTKVVTIDLQASWASMTLQCSLRYAFGQGGGLSFSGCIFPDTRLDQMGPKFSYVPFMPGYENWTALTIVRRSSSSLISMAEQGTQLGNLSDVYKSLAERSGKEPPLQPSPTALQLLGFSFSVADSYVKLKATIVSPEPGQDSVPPIRLAAASLDLQFRYKNPQIQRLAMYTRFVLQAPNVPGYATMDLSLSYAASKWTLQGNAGNISGALLYSLFDQSCNNEMLQLLKNISLDVNLAYNYDSAGKGSDFLVNGKLHLGPVLLKYDYEYKGKTAKPDEPLWTFAASLDIGGNNGTLVDVIAVICGKQATEFLPTWLTNIDIKPGEDKALTFLRIVKTGETLYFVLRLQLTDGSSVAFYRFSIGNKDPNVKKPPIVKTILSLTVSELPKVKNIPLIGELPQPFDELVFSWVSAGDGYDGLTRSDLTAISTQMREHDPVIWYKDNVKQDLVKPTDVLLPSGFHFIIVQAQKVTLDYAFGGKDKDKKPSTTALELHTTATTTSPIQKKIGPVTILGIGLGFDLNTNTLSLIIDGSLKLGPLDMTLLGFGVSFCFASKELTLKNILGVEIGFDLRGLSASFNQQPILLAGLFERLADGKSFQGAATVGFTPYLFQAVGYYGQAHDPNPTVFVDDDYTSFFTYCRLDGPLMSIFGFAELSGLSGGFGYNSTVAFPDTNNVLQFPFIAPQSEDDPSKALYNFLHGGWFSPKRDTYWIAAGVKVMAFEMLEVNTVVTVEFGSSLKFGLFGLATAEMPKRATKKFVKVQMGVAATVDFGAGTLKIDGQLTPVSFILDPSCHLTGGFAMYSWFDARDKNLDGDWVFTIGGYHKAFKTPSQYPVPPRLGISWSFDKNISITGEAYFAINSKVCMGGGRLKVTLSLGALDAYFDAYADFLINYKPFHFQAEGGICVGVHFSLDLWLVSINISVDIAAQLYLEGPPLHGRVHVDFYVFGFDVDFGSSEANNKTKLNLDQFYALCLQSDAQQPALIMGTDGRNENQDDLSSADNNLTPHIFSCTSGLVPSESVQTEPNNQAWRVRGAIFAFSISCKFALTNATIVTKSLDPNFQSPTHDVKNKATDKVFSRPMGLFSPFSKSALTVTISLIVPPHALEDKVPLNPEWDRNTAILTSVPTALWGKYDASEDPSNGDNNIGTLLDGTKEGTCQLMTGVTILSPTDRLSPATISEFDVLKAMGQVAGRTIFPEKNDASNSWSPTPEAGIPYQDVEKRWKNPLLGADAGIEAAKLWCEFAAFNWKAGAVSGVRPATLIEKLDQIYTESPLLSDERVLVAA